MLGSYWTYALNMKPICWVVKTAVPGGSGRWCAAAGGAWGGFYWCTGKKKTRIEVVSCAIFAYLRSQGFVFYSDCDLTQAPAQTNTDEFMLWALAWNLTDNPVWSQCTGYALYMCWRFFFWVAWNKKRAEKERDAMVLEPGQKMKILYDQQSVNNVSYSQQDTLKG